jgi:hypothetical protein
MCPLVRFVTSPGELFCRRFIILTGFWRMLSSVSDIAQTTALTVKVMMLYVNRPIAPHLFDEIFPSVFLNEKILLQSFPIFITTRLFAFAAVVRLTNVLIWISGRRSAALDLLIATQQHKKPQHAGRSSLAQKGRWPF